MAGYLRKCGELAAAKFCKYVKQLEEEEAKERSEMKKAEKK